MGVIAKIRKQLWIIPVMVGLGLLGFIMMDMNSGGGSMGNNNLHIGEVDGTPIDWREFQRTESILYQNSNVDVYGRRQYLWENFVDKAVLDQEAKHIGFGVCADELNELEFGTNLSEVILRNFRDPNTGVVNREQLNQFRDNMDSPEMPDQLKEFWKIQEQEIIKDRMNKKVQMLVSKAMYTPSFMAIENHKHSNERMTIAFCRIPYNVLEDSLITPTEADYAAYLKEHGSEFKTTEESRNIKLLEFAIVPTVEDSMKIRTDLEAKIAGFISADNDSSYVTSNLGKWTELYTLKGNIAPALSDSLFRLSKGQVYGPYIENGEYKLSKVIGKKIMPDSVKSRHILRRVQTQEQAFAEKRFLDSLKTELEKGKIAFDSLARNYSADQGTAVVGGDLGYVPQGQTVEQYNEVLFHRGEKGKYYVIGTQFGLHLVQVVDQKFITKSEGIRLATISELIVPSEATTEKRYDEAQSFISTIKNADEFEKAADDGKQIKFMISPLVKRNDYALNKVSAISNNTHRDIIRWAYDKRTEVGDVSPEVFSMQDDNNKYTSKYILALLDVIQPKGNPTVASAREIIKPLVIKDLKYKQIKEKIGTVTDLASLGSGYYQTKVDTTDQVTLSGGNIDAFNNEFNVVAELCKMQPGQVGGPYKGEDGVFVVQLLVREPVGSLSAVDQFKRFMKHPAKSTAMRYVMPSLREKYKIKDNRFDYF